MDSKGEKQTMKTCVECDYFRVEQWCEKRKGTTHEKTPVCQDFEEVKP
jgi:hypothetical protein